MIWNFRSGFYIIRIKIILNRKKTLWFSLSAVILQAKFPFLFQVKQIFQRIIQTFTKMFFFFVKNNSILSQSTSEVASKHFQLFWTWNPTQTTSQGPSALSNCKNCINITIFAIASLCCCFWSVFPLFLRIEVAVAEEECKPNRDLHRRWIFGLLFYDSWWLSQLQLVDFCRLRNKSISKRF